MVRIMKLINNCNISYIKVPSKLTRPLIILGLFFRMQNKPFGGIINEIRLITSNYAFVRRGEIIPVMCDS